MPFIRKLPEKTAEEEKMDKCFHPEHNPPMHIVLQPGEHTWKCPSCGKETTFIVPNIRW